MAAQPSQGTIVRRLGITLAPHTEPQSSPQERLQVALFLRMEAEAPPDYLVGHFPTASRPGILQGPDRTQRYRLTDLSSSATATARHDSFADGRDWLLLCHGTDDDKLEARMVDAVITLQRDISGTVQLVEADEEAAKKLKKRFRALAFSTADDAKVGSSDSGDDEPSILKKSKVEATPPAPAVRDVKASEARRSVKQAQQTPTPSVSPQPSIAAVTPMTPPLDRPRTPPELSQGLIRIVERGRGTTQPMVEVFQRVLETIPEFEEVKRHPSRDYQQEWFRVCKAAITAQLRELGCQIIGKSVTMPLNAATPR